VLTPRGAAAAGLSEQVHKKMLLDHTMRNEPLQRFIFECKNYIDCIINQAIFNSPYIADQ
jgi:hypothetical protein